MYLKEIDIKQVLTDATLHQPADLLDDSESLQSLAANIDKFNSTVLANLEERLSKGLHQISKDTLTSLKLPKCSSWIQPFNNTVRGVEICQTCPREL